MCILDNQRKANENHIVNELCDCVVVGSLEATKRRACKRREGRTDPEIHTPKHGREEARSKRHTRTSVLPPRHHQPTPTSHTISSVLLRAFLTKLSSKSFVITDLAVRLELSHRA